MEKKSAATFYVGWVCYSTILYVKENKGSKDSRNRPVSNYSCIDGQHRLRTMFDFMNDEFALHEQTPDVDIDGDIYQIAGLKYSELPEGTAGGYQFI